MQHEPRPEPQTHAAPDLRVYTSAHCRNRAAMPPFFQHLYQSTPPSIAAKIKGWQVERVYLIDQPLGPRPWLAQQWRFSRTRSEAQSDGVLRRWVYPSTGTHHLGSIPSPQLAIVWFVMSCMLVLILPSFSRRRIRIEGSGGFPAARGDSARQPRLTRDR